MKLFLFGLSAARTDARLFVRAVLRRPVTGLRRDRGRNGRLFTLGLGVWRLEDYGIGL